MEKRTTKCEATRAQRFLRKISRDCPCVARAYHPYDNAHPNDIAELKSKFTAKRTQICDM
jgi:hypothetical protein